MPLDDMEGGRQNFTLTRAGAEVRVRPGSIMLSKECKVKIVDAFIIPRMYGTLISMSPG